MAGLSLQLFNRSRVGKFLDESPRKAGRDVLRALKPATRSTNTHAVRLASKNMGLKAKDVRNRIKVTLPTGRTLAGILRANLRRVPLILFGARGPEPSRQDGEPHLSGHSPRWPYADELQSANVLGR